MDGGGGDDDGGVCVAGSWPDGARGFFLKQIFHKTHLSSTNEEAGPKASRKRFRRVGLTDVLPNPPPHQSLFCAVQQLFRDAPVIFHLLHPTLNPPEATLFPFVLSFSSLSSSSSSVVSRDFLICMRAVRSTFGCTIHCLFLLMLSLTCPL